MAGSSGIDSHARRGAEPQPGDEDQMSARSQGAGKAATSTKTGSSRVTAGAGADPAPSPRPWPSGPTSTAPCHAAAWLSPSRLRPQPLRYPPLACRWQETAENEDFTALANSQGSLDGRKMLKTFLKCQACPMGLSTLQADDLRSV